MRGEKGEGERERRIQSYKDRNLFESIPHISKHTHAYTPAFRVNTMLSWTNQIKR